MDGIRIRLAVFCILLGSGCAGGNSRDDPYDRVQSKDVHEVNMLIRQAIDTNDVRAIPYLIKNLTHEDQWTRNNAHTALIKIVLEVTGKTVRFGYFFLDVYSDDPERVRRAKQAIRAWEDWWEREGKLLIAESRSPSPASPTP